MIVARLHRRGTRRAWRRRRAAGADSRNAGRALRDRSIGDGHCLYSVPSPGDIGPCRHCAVFHDPVVFGESCANRCRKPPSLIGHRASNRGAGSAKCDQFEADRRYDEEVAGGKVGRVIRRRADLSAAADVDIGSPAQQRDAPGEGDRCGAVLRTLRDPVLTTHSSRSIAFGAILAHSLGISANIQESTGMSKTLIKTDFSEEPNGIKRLKTASQAYDEGSIPFTRQSAKSSPLPIAAASVKVAP